MVPLEDWWASAFPSSTVAFAIRRPIDFRCNTERLPDTRRNLYMAYKGQRTQSSGSRYSRESKNRKRRIAMHKTAEQVETEILDALNHMREVSQSGITNNSMKSVQKFPTVRECNAALAALGDSGDLLRALRLFGKMRKATILKQKLRD